MPSFSSLTASCASLVDEGATNRALAVAYTLPEGPSETVDFIQTFLPFTLSTSAVQRMVAPALIFCKDTECFISCKPLLLHAGSMSNR